MTEGNQDLGLGHGPEAPSGSVSVPTERGSDRFTQGRGVALMGSGTAVILAAPVGERIARGVAELVTQGSSELAVRAWGNIGSGLGLVAALVGSGFVLYRVFRR